MKQLLVFSAIIGVLLTQAGCEKKDVDRIGLVKLSDGVYAMIASGPTPVEGLGANSGFVAGTDGVLVIDSRYTPALAHDLLTAIRSVTSAPIRYVVNTHYHPDHTWGNMVFKEQGAVIVARAETREALLKYSPVYLEFYKARGEEAFEMLRDVKITAPDTTFGDETEIDLGGTTVVLRYFGPAHTAGDCVVIVPRGRVAFAGGLLSNGYHPNMGDPGVDFDNWAKTLDRLGAMNIRYFVPGQGKVCGTKALVTEKNYLKSLRAQCVDAMRKMTPMERVAASIAVPGAEDYLQPNILPFNVQAVYRFELPRVVRPDFTIDLPAGFEITDGGGGPERGMIRWGERTAKGRLEIEVQWKPTARREVITQDIAEQVARYAETGEHQMGIDGTKRIAIGDEKAAAAYGGWKFKPELGTLGGGLWTWAQVIRDGKLYSIQLSTDARYDMLQEKKNMIYLEEIASTFKVNRQ